MDMKSLLKISLFALPLAYLACESTVYAEEEEAPASAASEADHEAEAPKKADADAEAEPAAE